ncbi:sensor histidine kinase [Azospirillum sp. sgz302134]
MLTAVALVAVWGGYAQVSRAVLHDHTLEAVARAETMVGAFEKSTHRALHEVDITLRNVALEYAEGGLEHARRLFDQDLYDRSLIHHFAILNAKGEMVFRSEGRSERTGGPADRIDDDAVAFHQGTGRDLMRIGRPFPGTNGGEPLLPLSRRLNGPDGAFAGIIVANVDPDIFGEFYRQANLGPLGTATLIGLDKVIRARGAQQASEAVGRAIPHSRLWEEVSRSVAGVYWQDTMTDGELRAYAYRVVEGYPLVAAVGVATADIEAGVAELRRTLFVIAVLLTTSIILVAAFLLVQHRSAERLQAALNVNRNFLARISHELRTPLNAILGFSEIIRDQLLGPQDTKRYAGYAKDIHDSGRHLLTLINDILDLSRLQEGTLALDPRPLDIATAIEWAIRMIAPQAEAKRIQVDVNVQPGIGSLTVDERALKQMLLNLLTNAVTFTPEGGRVLVTVSAGLHGRIRLRVADNGIGMTPEQLSHALVPFGQSAAMVARPGQGSGLGLPIVKSLMEAHGGQLLIDSHPGQGSQFTLEFAR